MFCAQCVERESAGREGGRVFTSCLWRAKERECRRERGSAEEREERECTREIRYFLISLTRRGQRALSAKAKLPFFYTVKITKQSVAGERGGGDQGQSKRENAEKQQQKKKSFSQNRQWHLGAPERRRVPLVKAPHRFDELRQVEVDVLVVKGLDDRRRRRFCALCRGGGSGVL